MVYAALGIIWVVLLITAFSSLRSLDISVWAKWMWFLFILGVPIMGLAIYAIRCLICADWSALKPLMISRSGSVSKVRENAPRK